MDVFAPHPPTGPGQTATPGINVNEIGVPDTSGPRYFWTWHQQLSRFLKTVDAEVYHASDLYTLPAAAAAARARGAKYTYDARELYSRVASTVGRPWVSYFWQVVEKAHVRGCHAVFTVSNSIADHLAQTYNIPRPTVVENVPENRQATGDQNVPSLRHLVHCGEKDLLVLHQGQMRSHRGCETLVSALAATPGHVHAVFLGSGPLGDKLRSQAASLGLDSRVHFLSAVPPDQLLTLTRGADVGVTLLEDVCLNHRMALPNKLFEYLAAGLPILGSDLPEIRSIIDRFEVGLVCTPGDPVDTADKLTRMLSDSASRNFWRGNCAKVFETFNWESASHRFVEPFTATASS